MSEYEYGHEAEHPELIPQNTSEAEQRVLVVLSTERLPSLSKVDFLRGWWAIAWFSPGFHPDDANAEEGTKPEILAITEEAFRRAGLGELSDSELYPAEATHNRIWVERGSQK